MIPQNLVPLDKWSPTNLVPLDKWSLEYSVCRGGQAVIIWKYGDQIGWGQLVHGDQIFVDHLSMETKFDGDRLSRETKFVGDHLSMGTKFFGTICPLGPNLMGTVCPGGPNWLGTICPRGPNFWGPFVHVDRKWGTGSLGIKWVRDQMSHSHLLKKRVAEDNASNPHDFNVVTSLPKYP